MKKETLERFWAKVDKRGPDECWPWIAHETSGYGQFRYDGRAIYAHRFSYELHKGEIPKGQSVCHHCDNPECVNPDHLFLGDHMTNAEDSIKKGRGGHQKLSIKEVREVRKLYATGQYRQTKLAKMFGITPPSIYLIINNLSYTGVK